MLSIRTWGHAILQKREDNKFLQTTYGPFYQLVLTCFLENPIGYIYTHNKDVNSRGIKYFKGRKYRDFNFSLDHVRAGGGGGGGGALWMASVRFLSARNLMSEKLLSATIRKVKIKLQALKKLPFLFYSESMIF